MKLKTTQIKNKTTKELYNIFVNSGKFPNIKELLDWIVENLPNNQEIEVTPWFNSLYYIEVKYKNIMGYKYPAYMQMGFSVDITEDRLIWNMEGNCYCRNTLWKKKLLHFPVFTSSTYLCIENLISFYKPAKREKIIPNSYLYSKTRHLL